MIFYFIFKNILCFIRGAFGQSWSRTLSVPYSNFGRIWHVPRWMAIFFCHSTVFIWAAFGQNQSSSLAWNLPVVSPHLSLGTPKISFAMLGPDLGHQSRNWWTQRFPRSQSKRTLCCCPQIIRTCSVVNVHQVVSRNLAPTPASPSSGDTGEP
jgi:hypothetical protein